MTIFLILAPFGSFALLMLVTSVEISLFASAAICLAVIGIDVYRGRSIKMLGAGTVLVFTALGAYIGAAALVGFVVLHDGIHRVTKTSSTPDVVGRLDP